MRTPVCCDTIEKIRLKAVGKLDDVEVAESLIRDMDPAGDDYRIVDALLAKAEDQELVEQKYHEMRASSILEARETAAEKLKASSEDDIRGDRELHFEKLVQMMDSEQARHDRMVGTGGSPINLPDDLKKSVAVIAGDKALLNSLYHKLLESPKGNWGFTWRYYSPLRKEIERLSGEKDED